MRSSRCDQSGMQAGVLWLSCPRLPPPASSGIPPPYRLDRLAAPACAPQLACDLRANTPKDRRFLARHARALMPHTLPGWLVRGGGVDCSVAVAALPPPCCHFRCCSAALSSPLWPACMRGDRLLLPSQPEHTHLLASHRRWLPLWASPSPASWAWRVRRRQSVWPACGR